MSDMTISQIREAKERAQEQIGEILLSLAQRTGLRVSEVQVRSTVFNSLTSRSGDTLEVRTVVVLEAI